MAISARQEVGKRDYHHLIVLLKIGGYAIVVPYHNMFRMRPFGVETSYRRSTLSSTNFGSLYGGQRAKMPGVTCVAMILLHSTLSTLGLGSLLLIAQTPAGEKYCTSGQDKEIV